VREAGRIAVQGEVPAPPPRALPPQQEDVAPVVGWRPETLVAGVDQSVCFRVEVPANIIDGLIRFGWLRPSQRDDVLAVLLALQRTPLSATVTRLS
jgi:hypothetical protein